MCMGTVQSGPLKLTPQIMLFILYLHMFVCTNNIAFNRRFFLHKMKPNHDNDVEILHKYIMI